jgi:hypothetical protein
VLGILLAAFLLSFIGAAVREGMLEPGLTPPRRRRWWARGAIAVGALVIALLLWGGKHWWEAEAADYRNNRLYQPIACVGHVQMDNGHGFAVGIRTQFSRSTPRSAGSRQSDISFSCANQKLDAPAHLPAIKRDRKTFGSDAASFAAANRLYTDVAYETGYSITLTAD